LGIGDCTTATKRHLGFNGTSWTQVSVSNPRPACLCRDGRASVDYRSIESVTALPTSAQCTPCSMGSLPAVLVVGEAHGAARFGRTVSYNAHNKATQIASSAWTAQFMYGADDNRIRSTKRVRVRPARDRESSRVFEGVSAAGDNRPGSLRSDV
jgi:hypothetical protein